MLQTIQSNVTVSVENSAPRITQISPEAQGTGDSSDRLHCHVEVEDLDGGTPNTEIVWKLNNDEIGKDTTLQLSPEMVNPNDKVYCMVQAEDEHGGSVEAYEFFEVAI